MTSNNCIADLPSMSSRTASSLNSYRMNRTHCARAAKEVTHLYASGRALDLAITQRLHVHTVDTQTERPWTTCVRRVKSPQPGYGAGVRFVLSFAARSSTQSFGLFVRKA